MTSSVPAAVTTPRRCPPGVPVARLRAAGPSALNLGPPEPRVGALPFRLCPLGPHLPLCNSTSVCALRVTLDPTLGPATGRLRPGVPRIWGVGVERTTGQDTRSRRPLPSFLFGTFLPARPACPKQETRRVPGASSSERRCGCLPPLPLQVPAGAPTAHEG